MSVFERVREKAIESNWKSSPYKGFAVEKPSSTYDEIVSMAFGDAHNTANHAKHSRYDEMYAPLLGTFRERKMYTSLAPSLCIARPNRAISYQQTPHRAYSTKRGEWLIERDRNHHRTPPRYSNYPLRANSEPPMEPICRRTIPLPTTTTRFENYFRYWKGRACGLDYVAPFLGPEDWRPAEDRRYHRIFWSPEFINITPSCRHATHLMLSAY